MPPVQDILEWPSEWVAEQMGWAAGPSVPTTSMALAPFPGWQGKASGGSAFGSAGTGADGYWSGVFSSGSSGPQGNQV